MVINQFTHPLIALKMKTTIFAALCTLFSLTFTACSNDDNNINPLIFNNWNWGTADDEIILCIFKNGTFEWGFKNPIQPTGNLPTAYLITQGRWEATSNKLLLIASNPRDWNKGRRQFRYKITNKKDGINDYYELEMQEYDPLTHKDISTPLHLFLRGNYLE